MSRERRSHRLSATGTFAGAFPPGSAGDSQAGPRPSGTPTAVPRRGTRVGRLWRPVTVGLALLGPLIGLMAHREARDFADDRLRSEFRRVVSERVHLIAGEIQALGEVLHACRGLYNASEVVTPQEFALFTKDAGLRHPEIAGIFWTPRVGHADRERFEEGERAGGSKDYRIWQWGEGGQPVAVPERSVYFPVRFAAPAAPSTDAMGFDLASEPIRREALLRAQSSHREAMTSPVPVVHGEGRGLGALVMLGVFERPGSDARAGDGPIGYVVVAFRFADFMDRIAARAWDARAPRMDLGLSVVGASGGGVVVYSRFPGEAEERFSVSQTVDAAGQPWTVRCTPTAQFFADHPVASPVIVALAVAAAWEVLVGFLVLLAGAWRLYSLRRQARMVRHVLRSLGDGVAVVDRAGRVRLANEAAVRFVGAGADDIPFQDWLGGCDTRRSDGTTPCPPAEHPLARALAETPVDGEQLLVRPSGAADACWVSVSARPLYDDWGALQGAVATMQDVTQRRRSEEHLHRLSSAIEQTADVVYITDRHGRIQYANAAFEAATGYARTEALGSTPRILRSGRQDAAFYRNLWATIRRGRVWQGMIVNRRRNGEEWHSAQTITPVQDATGRVTHYVAVAHDITERRRLQAAEVEMGLAAEVQRRLYPAAAPRSDHLDIAGAVVPAEATCGDYYDYLPGREGTVGIVIGDVSGHGLGSALVMAQTRAYVRSLAETGMPPAEVLRRVNAHLAAELAEGLFVTLLQVTVEERSGRIEYASAGHTPAFLLSPGGEVKATLRATGRPLGIWPDGLYASGTAPSMEPGDVLVLVTDGVTECAAPDGSLFEEEGVLECVRAHLAEGAADIVEHLQRRLREHAGKQSPRDDVTAVIVKARPRAG